MQASAQLMFQGKGDVQAALDLWRAALPGLDLRILAGSEGQVTHAAVTLPGLSLTLFESPVTHAFGFTPAIALALTCDSAAEVERLADILGAGGQVMMPLDAYDFSPCFTWFSDRFGVSWQVMLAPS